MRDPEEEKEQGLERHGKGETLIHESFELVEGILGNNPHFCVEYEECEEKRNNQQNLRICWLCVCVWVCVASASLRVCCTVVLKSYSEEREQKTKI